MFKIVGKEGNKYAVLDTTDWTVELLSGDDLFVLKSKGVEIAGCTYSGDAIFTHIDEVTHHSPVANLSVELSRYFNELLDAKVILPFNIDTLEINAESDGGLFKSYMSKNFEHHCEFLYCLVVLAVAGKLCFDMSLSTHQSLLKKLGDIIKLGYQNSPYDEASKETYIVLDCAMLKMIQSCGVREVSD